MKIRKINTEIELDVTVKNVRLPNLEECTYISLNSFNYLNDRLFHAFFKEFIRDEDGFMDCAGDEYQPIYGNQYDCGGMIDLIPVVETKDTLEEGTIYVSSNCVPFKAVTENKLICLTRVNYFIDGGSEGIDFNELCNSIDENLADVDNW